MRDMEIKEKIFRNKTIKYTKVYWTNHVKKGATWDLKCMRIMYLELFLSLGKCENKFYLIGEDQILLKIKLKL